MEPEPEPKLNIFGSATLLFCVYIKTGVFKLVGAGREEYEDD